MLNNLTNFFNLIRGRKIKKTLANSDLIAIGVRDDRFDGNYQPSAIKFQDLQTQVLPSVDGVTITGTGLAGDPLVAAAPTPPYKVYRALLTQTGALPPTAVVLENTLSGSIVWTRTFAGFYTGTLVGEFPVDKVFIQLTNRDQNTITYAGRSNDDELFIFTFSISDFSLPGPVQIDNALTSNSIEIRVYP